MRLKFESKTHGDDARPVLGARRTTEVGVSDRAYNTAEIRAVEQVERVRTDT